MEKRKLFDAWKSLHDLDVAAGKIYRAHIEFENQYLFRIGSLHFGGDYTQKKRNELYAKHNLPEMVLITPELASFLVKDQIAFDEKAAKMENQYPYWSLLSLPYRVMNSVFAPSPTNVASTASGVRDFIKKVEAHQEEYEKISRSRHILADFILNTYFLTETDGSYFLTLPEHYVAYSASVGPRNASTPRGVSRDLDISKLPDLPTPESLKATPILAQEQKGKPDTQASHATDMLCVPDSKIRTASFTRLQNMASPELAAL